jgi:hypothetical protein
MTTKQKKTPALTTGTKKPLVRRCRITKREKRTLEAWKEHAEGRVHESDFFRDQQLLATAMAYLTGEEIAELSRKEEIPRPSSCGTRFFDAEFLPIAAKAIRRRDEMLMPQLEQLEQLMPEIVHGYDVTPADVKIIITRLRQRLDQYSGPPQSEPFVWWAMEQVAATIRTLRIIRKVEAENAIAFADVYQRARRSAWAGVLEVLKGCHDLGATHDVAEELVHVTMIEILCDIENWRDDGEASIQTRVYAFARDQALGWRQSRIREKRRRRRLLGGVRRRRRVCLYPPSAIKSSSE